jgi:hypothetical protein
VVRDRRLKRVQGIKHDIVDIGNLLDFPDSSFFLPDSALLQESVDNRFASGRQQIKLVGHLSNSTSRIISSLTSVNGCFSTSNFLMI